MKPDSTETTRPVNDDCTLIQSEHQYCKVPVDVYEEVVRTFMPLTLHVLSICGSSVSEVLESFNINNNTDHDINDVSGATTVYDNNYNATIMHDTNTMNISSENSYPTVDIECMFTYSVKVLNDTMMDTTIETPTEANSHNTGGVSVVAYSTSTSYSSDNVTTNSTHNVYVATNNTATSLGTAAAGSTTDINVSEANPTSATGYNTNPDYSAGLATTTPQEHTHATFNVTSETGTHTGTLPVDTHRNLTLIVERWQCGMGCIQATPASVVSVNTTGVEDISDSNVTSSMEPVTDTYAYNSSVNISTNDDNSTIEDAASLTSESMTIDSLQESTVSPTMVPSTLSNIDNSSTQQNISVNNTPTDSDINTEPFIGVCCVTLSGSSSDTECANSSDPIETIDELINDVITAAISAAVHDTVDQVVNNCHDRAGCGVWVGGNNLTNINISHSTTETVNTAQPNTAGSIRSILEQSSITATISTAPVGSITPGLSTDTAGVAIQTTTNVESIPTVYCGPPPNIGHGHMIVYGKKRFAGSSMRYKCYSGFKMQDGSVTKVITCTQHGYWTDYQVECKRKYHMLFSQTERNSYGIVCLA